MRRVGVKTFPGEAERFAAIAGKLWFIERKKMKRLMIAVALASGLLAVTAAFAQLETRTSTSGGVTVKVTPKTLASDAAAWEFAVVLDTHSQDLSDDLSKTASLAGGSGARRLPTAWEGAAPGGHHREGVLRFQPIRPAPAAVELQIRRQGENTPRAFRWTLK